MYLKAAQHGDHKGIVYKTKNITLHKRPLYFTALYNSGGGGGNGRKDNWRGPGDNCRGGEVSIKMYPLF